MKPTTAKCCTWLLTAVACCCVLLAGSAVRGDGNTKGSSPPSEEVHRLVNSIYADTPSALETELSRSLSSFRDWAHGEYAGVAWDQSAGARYLDTRYVPASHEAAQNFNRAVTSFANWAGAQDVSYLLVQDTAQPFQETQQPFQDTSSLFGSQNPFVSPASRSELLSELQQSFGGVAEGFSSSEVLIASGTEISQILAASDSIQTVNVQRRSAVAFDPHVRGYRTGQIYTQAAGSQWVTVRPDLDSILSKIDPSLVRNIVVIPGPYGVRYGPGLSFIDVLTVPTPRYQNGSEVHGRLGIDVRPNGGQFSGRTSAYGGGEAWGFLLNYSKLIGSDYLAGNGQNIPGTYNNQTYWGQFGLDLSEDSRVEFRYQRLDQGDTQYAGQLFDVNALVTNAFSINYVNENPTFFGNLADRFWVDVWYNETGFHGSTPESPKTGFTRFPVVQRVDAALDVALGPGDFSGITNGDQLTSGARAAVTFGAEDWEQLTVGADIRYRKQRIQELFTVTALTPPDIATNMPKADITDPGVFGEYKIPWSDWLTTTAGVRLDFVHTDADRAEQRGDTSLKGPFSQDNTLYAFYLAGDIALNENWNARVAFGHGQRPPTLIERYADGLFLGIIQSGFSRVIGTPGLRPERAWQIDTGLEFEYEYARGWLRGYHAWIHDYITYEGNVISEPTGARLLKTINTDTATLSGFELYGERDMTDVITVFGSLQYISGRDQTIARPLPQISPLEGRAGIRLHDSDGGNTWGVELAARIVDLQNRLGTVRVIGAPGTFTPIETETAGFTVFDLRGYWNASENARFVAGIDNLLGKSYLEHLDIRYEPQGQIPAASVLSPGFNAFMGFELIR